MLLTSLAGEWGEGRGGERRGRKSVLSFEEIAVAGNVENHESVKPLLRKTSPKTLFFSKFNLLFLDAHVLDAKRDGFCP